MGDPDLRRGLPGREGLYDPDFEHDACGVAFVVDLHGRKSHERIRQGLTALCNLDHRGASGSEVNTGDGAGITIQVPDRFLREAVPFDLPPAGRYATGIAFLPAEPDDAAKAVATLDDIAAQEGVHRPRLARRPHGPVDARGDGRRRRCRRSGSGSSPRTTSRASTSTGGPTSCASAASTRRRCTSRRCRRGSSSTRACSRPTSSRSSIPSSRDERVESALALVHSRFSTNTFPSWPLAHPYRYLAHNGEINTVMGNRNWMRAREALLASDVIPGDLDRIFPICTPGASDTATFDEVFELLHLGGRSLPHAVLMMIPEAWENHDSMSPAKRAFYRFHASLMEPWDGPASIAFTDGTVMGAVLDRNGLRPSRYWVTDDGLVIMASEAGVLDVPPSEVVTKGRLEPGRMFLVDTTQGRIVDDEEIKASLAAARAVPRMARRRARAPRRPAAA